ncbi:MAG: hypothetical protein FVQ77_12190 [Cytophagales bacterium]|nr:hypothetical protein [Cytophagales bacterium]
MATVILSICLVGLAIALLSVRLIFLKKGEFKGTCATQSPFLRKEGIVCGICGKVVDQETVCEKEGEERSSDDSSQLAKQEFISNN